MEFLRAAVHGVEVADAVVYVALTLPQTAVDGAELLGYRKPCRVTRYPELSRLEACASFDCASLMRFAVIIPSLSMNFTLRSPRQFQI